MQPWGTRGMIRSWDQFVWYLDYDGRNDKHFKIIEKQKGPRGRLPFCPDTCFVTGGAFPSNGLPDDTGPEGEGLDYYDLLKGDTEEGTREPDPDTELEEQSGSNFHAHISDIKSGDVKWWSDSGGIPHILFIGSNRKVYCYKAAAEGGTGVKSWEVDIVASLITEFPLTEGESEHVQRTWRIDPKRSLVAGDKFLVLVSFCDWEIRPGKVITFSSDPQEASEGTTVNPEPYVSYPVDPETGVIQGYNAQQRVMPEPIEVDVSHSVIVDDSFRLLHYAHYFMVINLTGESRVGASIPIHEEFLCGVMDLVIQPQVREQGIYFKAQKAAYNYEMGIEQYNLVVPDGTVTGDSGTPHPNCASTLGVNLTGIALQTPGVPQLSPPHDPNGVCLYYWLTHWHPGVPSTVDPGVAKGDFYSWIDEPAQDDFSLVSNAVLDVDTATQWFEDGVTIPTDESMAETVHNFDPEEDLYEYPYGDNISINILSEGQWEYVSATYQTAYSTYNGPPVYPDLAWGFEYPSYGWSGTNTAYSPGNVVLYLWKPKPMETTRWKRGPELVAQAVYENCLSTDSSFSDIAMFPITETIEGQTVTKHVIAFLRWGANANPFNDAAIITDDPPDTHGDKHSFTASSTQRQKNNNPCVHRQARTANKLNFCLLVLEDNTITSIEIAIPDAALTCGEWAGDPYEWVAAETYELKSHDEVRPLSVWDEAENKVPADEDFLCGIMSADCHVQGSEAGAAYNTDAIIGGGTSGTGKQQQLVIPLKRGGALGSAFFMSCLGMLDGNVRYANWQQGVGDAQWCDTIHEQMQANKCVTGWAIVSSSGTILTYLPEGALTAGNFAGKWFCRWACYIELDTEEEGVTQEWIIVGMQFIDYRGPEDITCKFKVYGVNVLTGGTEEIWAESTGHLHTGAVVIPKSSDNKDARVIFSYSQGVNNAYGLCSAYLLSTLIITTQNGPYDQMIAEGNSGTRHLFALKAGEKLDIIDLADMTVKKSVATTANSISTGGPYRLAMREDTVVGDGVKTKIIMERYSA